MRRHVKRNYLENFYDQFCIEQQKNCIFCLKSDCRFSLQTLNLEGINLVLKIGRMMIGL